VEVFDMGEGCCHPLGEAESAFFSKEAVLKKYESFKALVERRKTVSKPGYLEDFLREANILKGQKVLEVGINPGYLAVHIAEIVGDKGKVALAQLDGIITKDAQKNIEKYKVENVVQIMGANVGKLPFSSSSFDRVLSDRTTSLLSRKSVLIEEMARVAKSPGKIVIADCISRKPFPKDQVEKFAKDFACVFQAASIKEYVDIFENSGLKGVKVIEFMNEECVRPHAVIKDKAKGHLGFAIIVGEKS
jgi:ubiquinone/menaquinone biosynthesis C-methylase UbiE